MLRCIVATAYGHYRGPVHIAASPPVATDLWPTPSLPSKSQLLELTNPLMTRP